MGLTVLDNQFRIKIANDDFFNSFIKYSTKSVRGKVQFHIYKNKKLEEFNSERDIHILKDLGFWVSYINKYDRFIYVFGVNEPNKTDSDIPICSIDFSISGIDKDTSAVFAQDKHGKVSVLYRVNQQNLTPKSFELEFSGGWLKAQEKDKNSYFILMGKLNEPNFIDKFKDFLIEFEKNITIVNKGHHDVENISNESNFKSCTICGKTISSIKSDHSSIIKELGVENSDYCTECVEKIAAINVLKKINQKISIKVFNKNSLLERVDDPDLFESYLSFLLALGFLKKINKNLLIYNKDKGLDQLKNTYHEDNNQIGQKTIPKDKCIKCGVVLSSDNCFKSDLVSNGLSEKCKDCSRKIYAVKALNHLEKYVVPGVSFNKNDLLKQVDNRTRFLDYIWTLQEFDLLDGLNDLYLLKPEEDLIKFKEKYGEEIKKAPTITSSKEKKPLKKVVKECETCSQVLPISKFYKSSISEDGRTEKCKDCSRKSYAVKALLELKKYVVPNIEFYKEDLLKQVDNRTQFLDYFWTLQEFDFIEHNEKADTYILKPENEISSFIKQYGEQTKETTTKEEFTDIEEKIVKKCLTCEETLPISNFYKSSISNDRYTENCKKCSDKINTANILSEIRKYIGIGNPFSKKELSKQLGNPTKVDYYIWILKEHDLIDYNEKIDTYVVEESSRYKKYVTFQEELDSEKTPKITQKKSDISDDEQTIKDTKEDSSVKEIIHISDGLSNNKIVLVMGIIQKNNLYSILEDIKDIITSSMINMTFNRQEEDLIKLFLELDIENDSYRETLKLLEEKNWSNTVKK